MPKPLIDEAPYPSVKELTADPFSARIISSAYATSCGELNSVLQYIYQSFIFNHGGEEQTAELLKSIAIAEMMHIDLLGNALVNLGAQPIYTFNPPIAFNFYSAKFVSYSHTYAEMLEDDVVAERHALSTYNKMTARLKNQSLKELITRILKDEKLHLAALTQAKARYRG